MTIQPEEFEGLKWVIKPWGLRPRWTADVDIEQIREVVRRVLPSPQELSITFLAKGAFNKVYNIRTQDQDLIMRVTLPVDPQWKTLSEVATLEWVRRNSHLPVPEVFAHDASRDNPIGFEWILMSKLPGRPLVDVWMSMDFAAKKQVTREVAIFFSSMFKKQLRGIGNLYPDAKLKVVESDDNDLPEVRRIVSMHFFWGDRITELVPRGPFRSSRDWLEACLLCNERDCKSVIARCNDKRDSDEDSDEDDLEIEMRRANDALGVISRLKLLLDDLFPSSKDEQVEPSILFHDDLAQLNIMVNEAGVLTGVVDWECVSALPLWKACDYPSFLDGPDLHAEPLEANYGSDSRDFFCEYTVRYDTTKLRKYFLEEMRKLEPGWVKVFEASALQRDFEAAVRHCTDLGMAVFITGWLDDITLGKENFYSLWDRAYNCILPSAANAVEVC